MTDRLRSLLDELKRRRVTRVVVVYVVAALGILQAAQLILPELLPHRVYTILVIIAIIGLPITIAVAWIFDVTPGGIERTASVDSAASQASESTTDLGMRRRRIAIFGIVAVILCVVWGGWRAMYHGEVPNADVIAVLPFRVSGGPTVGYLREGLVDLVNARLGDKPRAVDARTLMAAWRKAVRDSTTDLSERDAIDVARTLGAGRVLLGNVVNTGSRITLSAKLVDIDGHAVESGPIEGATDSIPEIVDRLVGAVLGLDAGVSSATIASLTTTSFPAMRAFLDGNALDRRGQYPSALARYNDALQIDSTFALAALYASEAADMTLGSSVHIDPRARRIAWDFRQRLSPSDRLYEEGKHEVTTSTEASIRKWEAIVAAMPDKPAAWYHLGDVLIHDGAVAGYNDHVKRAEAAFRHALRLDSTFVTPLLHLGFIAVDRHDTTALRDVAVKGAAIGSDAVRDYALDAIVLERKDPAELRKREVYIDTVAVDKLTLLFFAPQLGGDSVALRHAERAVNRFRALATTTQEINTAMDASARLALNEGRPREAAKYRNAVVPPGSVARGIILDALYWDGDTAVAAAAAHTLDGMLRKPDTTNAAWFAEQTNNICALEQWRLAHGITSSAAGAVQRLRMPPPDGKPVTRGAVLCAMMVDAMSASVTNRPDALARTLALDSVLRPGPAGMSRVANLAVMRLLERYGRTADALAASRRIYDNVGGEVDRSTYLINRARLAAKLGFRDEAIENYRLYLNLRFAPEPALIPERDKARDALNALLAEH